MILGVYQHLPEPVKNQFRYGRTRARMLAARRLGMESHENLLIDIFRTRNISVVFDVGAHDGEFGRWLRHLGYRGRILSFEPVSNHVERLRTAARGDRNWECFPFALGETEAQQDIQVATIGQFSSFLSTSPLSESLFGSKSQVVRTETVQIRRLDHVINEVFGDGPLNECCFLKMDTQGYDLRVLAGLGARVSEISALQSEISVQPLYVGMPTDVESLTQMRSQGFEIAGLFPVTRDRHHIVVEFDVIMVRPPATSHHV